MSGYYSDYLFHFTPTYERLISILQNGFSLDCWNTELTDYQKSLPGVMGLNINTPVICLTDIPLDKISKHTEKYGKFGIGLSKDWAIKNGAQPVIYVDKDNMGFGKCLKILLKNLGPVDNLDNPAVRAVLIYIIPLLKDLKDYEEREWRILASLTEDDDYLNFNKKDIRLIVVPRNKIGDLYIKLKEIFAGRNWQKDITFAIVPYEDLEKLMGKNT